MKQNYTKISLVMLFILVVSIALTAGVAASQDKPIVWTFATNPGPAANTWAFHPYPRFQELLERRSGGRLVVTTKVGLYPPKEVIHAVIGGQVEIGFERTPWLAGTFPEWDLSLPFFWDNIFEYEAFIMIPEWSPLKRNLTAKKN